METKTSLKIRTLKIFSPKKITLEQILVLILQKKSP